MEREELSTLAARFKRVMSESELNQLGRGVRFCRRERLLTPFRLAVSLVGSFALRQVETIADLQRAFNPGLTVPLTSAGPEAGPGAIASAG
jgi:hypothetical protein